MDADFVMCARNVRNGKFGNEPDATRFLFVPPDQQPHPSQNQDRKIWAKEVMKDAGRSRTRFGHILVFVHGYNNSQATVMQRHRQLRQDLESAGYRGTLVSYDWPSADSTINYLEDRVDAKKSALQLVTDGIFLFSEYQQPDCRIDVHLLAHSMGALVVREAFDDADDRRDLAALNWMVSQVMFIGADISIGSMSDDSSRSSSLYRHLIRLTNYSNRNDGVLGLSNVKRAGIAPRAGRHGLPNDAPPKGVNVDCSDYWETIPKSQPTIGNRGHSWHIGDPVFTQDLLLTMMGNENQSYPTRRVVNGKLVMHRPGQ